jgi:predicted nucleic acid-binding protein
MSDVVVSDSSCLIALSKIGHLEILQKLFGNIVIPAAVYREVVIQGAGKPGAGEVAQAEWIKSFEVQDRLAVRTLKLTLGEGESEAIVLASEQQAKFLVLDDWKARQMALGLSLPVIGTVAVLGKAVEKGFLSDLTSLLDQLCDHGFRFPMP